MLVSPQLVEHNRAVAKAKILPAFLLSDSGNKVAEQYGIRYSVAEDLRKIYQKFGIHVDRYNGDDSWSLPMPTRLIIDADGIIRYAEINPDYTVRPDPAEAIAALEKIIAK